MLSTKQRKIDQLKPVQLGSRRRLQPAIDPASTGQNSSKQQITPNLLQGYGGGDNNQSNTTRVVKNTVLFSNQAKDMSLGDSLYTSKPQPHFAKFGGGVLTLHQQTMSAVDPVTTVNLNLNLQQSTLNRNSMDPHAEFLYNQQSVSQVETYNESKQNQSIQLLNELDNMMVPTMLEVNFQKSSSKVRSRMRKGTRQSIRMRAGQASATRQTVKTEGLSGSSFGALMSVHGGAPPLHSDHVFIEMISPQIHSNVRMGSPSLVANQAATAKDEIINDINLAFDELKSLFPQKGVTSQQDSQNRSAVARAKKRNVGAILAQNRAQSSLAGAKAAASYQMIKTQQVTHRQNRAQSACGVPYMNRQTAIPSTSMLTSNVPTQRQQLQSQFSRKLQKKIASNNKFSSAHHTTAAGTLRNVPQALTNSRKSANDMYGGDDQAAAAAGVYEDSSKQQVSIYKMDSKQLLRGIMKKPPLRPQNNKYVKNGPIKRLKSAMIRSVFDHGIRGNPDKTDYQMEFKQVIGSSPQRPSSNTKKESRQINHSSQYSDAELLKQQSTKGAQINFPTFTATTPIGFYGSEMQVNTRQNGTGSALSMQEQFQRETISSNGKHADSYQNLIFGEQLRNQLTQTPCQEVDNQTDSSQGALTPENEPFLQAVVGMYKPKMLVKSPSRGDDVGIQRLESNDFSETTFMKFHGASQEYHPKGQEGETNQDGDQSPVREIQFTQETFQPHQEDDAERHSSQFGVISAEHQTRSSAGFPELNMNGSQQVVRLAQTQQVPKTDHQGKGNFNKEKLAPPMSDTNKMHISTTKSHNETLPLASNFNSNEDRTGNASAELISGSQGFFSVTRDGQQINHEIRAGEVQIGAPHYTNLPPEELLMAKLISIDSVKAKPTSSQGAISSDIHRETARNHYPSLLSSGFSQPQLVSKLNEDGEFLSVAPPQEGALIDQSSAASNKISSWNDLSRARQLEVEQAMFKRDQFLLAVLKQQIEEEQMHMYDLNYGLESGLIKTDPVSMNKVLINKIHEQHERWQTIVAENMHFLDQQQQSTGGPLQPEDSTESKVKVAYKDQNGAEFAEIRLEVKQTEGEQTENLMGGKNMQVHTRTLSQAKIQTGGEEKQQQNGAAPSQPQKSLGKIVVRMGNEKEAVSLNTTQYQVLLKAAAELPYSSNNDSNYGPVGRGIAEEVDEGATTVVIEGRTFTPEQDGRSSSAGQDDYKQFDLVDNADGGTASKAKHQNHASDSREASSEANMTQQLLDKTSTPVGTVLRKIEGSLLQNDDDRVVYQPSRFTGMGETVSTPGAGGNYLLERRLYTNANIAMGNISTNQDLVDDIGDMSLSRDRLQLLKENNSKYSFEFAESHQAVAGTNNTVNGSTMPQGGYTPKIKEPMKRFVNMNNQTKIPRIEQSKLQQAEGKTANETLGPLYQKHNMASKNYQTAIIPLDNNRGSQTSSPRHLNSVIESTDTGPLDYSISGRQQKYDPHVRPSTSIESQNFLKEGLHNCISDSFELKNHQLQHYRAQHSQFVDVDILNMPKVIARSSLRNNNHESTKGSQEKLNLPNKGPAIHQTVFDMIDVEKLSSSKLLNRHIHGQTSNQYNLIKEESRQRAAGSKTPQLVVLNERDRTMISQQSANQKVLRNHKISVTRAASKQSQRSSMLIRASKNSQFQLTRTSEHVSKDKLFGQAAGLEQHLIESKLALIGKKTIERNTLSNSASHQNSGSNVSANPYLGTKPTLTKHYSINPAKVALQSNIKSSYAKKQVLARKQGVQQ